jgi:hypothetical protein
MLHGLIGYYQKLLLKHATYKSILIEGSSLGWVDHFRGILLISDVFGECRVIKYISLPASGGTRSPRATVLSMEVVA